MTDTLIPPLQPSVSNTQGTTTARMITAKFGDGYKASAADGVNSLERSYTLSWDPIEVEDADTIVRFLEAHVGAVFYYRLPREQSPRTWIWTNCTRTHPYPRDDALTITIEERYVF